MAKTTASVMRYFGSGVKEKQELNVILEKLEEYIVDRDYPLLAEFCIENKISRGTITLLEASCKENKDYRLSDLIEALYGKAEVYLEKNSLAGNIDSRFAMFTLKQRRHGWKDKIEVEAEADMNLNLNIKFK